MNSSQEPRTTDLESMRPRLLALAYRMLGSAADAEDAVQDAYLRLQQTGGIDSPEAWLVKTTTRLCIDHLRKAKRRAEYVGPWLPEPIPDSWEEPAPDRLELAESVSMAFLVLLESLSPAERAAYLLREVFNYEFEEIAALLDKTAVNVRQITVRAKKRLGQREHRYHPEAAQADALADRFFAACRAGDIHSIESLLAEDVVYYSDGGGKAHAAPRPLVGRPRIAKLLSVVFRKGQRSCVLSSNTVNGQPGLVFTQAGKAVLVLTFAVEEGRVGGVYGVLNPDKLRLWTPATTTDPDEPNSSETRRRKTMEQRLDFPKLAPEAVKALYGLETYLAGCGLEQSLRELVKIRASQINGCAFCIDMHTKDARAAGETEQRIYALNAWRDTPFFNERERAALAWVETVTRIGGGVPDDLYAEVKQRFSDKELVDLTWAVAAINAWNRVVISFRIVPGSYEPKKQHA